MVECDLGALQRAGNFGVVLEQQSGGWFQSVDGVHQVVLVGGQQVGGAVGEANGVEQQGIQVFGVATDGFTDSGGRIEGCQDVAGGGAVGVAEPLKRAPIGGHGVH